MRHEPSIFNDPARVSAHTDLRIGMVSTYPPTVCGLATFASALVHQFEHAGHLVDVAHLGHGAADTIATITHALRHSDVVILQHEYGIFNGPDGDEVLAILDAIQVPTIVVAHTVPLHPTNHQREVLTEVCRRASRVVVMTQTARDRLLSLYPVDPDVVVTIPHGAALPVPEPGGLRPVAGRPPELLTWGLLGPGKGIEHVIDALGDLRLMGIRPRYTIAGVTHPNVLADHGEQYRDSLIDRAASAGIADTVRFDASYRSVADLTRFIASASVVVLPYDSRDQVTSGVLVDAITAGRPVIATAFPHAVELLSSGAGVVVAHGDVGALAAAIRELVQHPTKRAAMAAEAQRLAPSLAWPAIAARYLAVCSELGLSRQAVAS